MANLRDIRRRIKSVKSTSQITKAMQLVAAAKMKKAQNQALAGRDYADEMNKVLTNLKANVDENAHPLLEVREGGKTLMLVISTNKGLCGGLNTNLLKKVREEADDALFALGEKYDGVKLERLEVGAVDVDGAAHHEVGDDPKDAGDKKGLGAAGYLGAQRA